MFCTNCGLPVPADSVFCENCGTPLDDKTGTKGPEIVLPAIQNPLELAALFRNNAFHILGMDAGSDTKIIQKRGKEIINRLKIDDLPEYSLDFEKPELFRNEVSVKDAIQKITSPKTSIGEYFFWFDFGSNASRQELVDSIEHAEYSKVFALIQKSLENTGGNSFSERKNLAIFLSVLLGNRNFKSCLIPSLDAWKTLVDSEESWDTFFDFYSGKTGFNLNREIKEEFRKQAVAKLSDLFTDISKRLDDPDYLLEYRERFSITSKKTEKDVLGPVLQKIHARIDDLKALEISPANKNNPAILNNIDGIIEKILDELDVLTSFGLDEDSQVKASRDEAAEAVRRLSVQIHNSWDNYASALELLNAAQDISGTSSYCASLSDDIRQIEETKENSRILDPIDETIQRKRYADALQAIENQEKRSQNHHLQDLLKDRKKLCVTAVAIDRYTLAKEAFKNNKNDESVTHYEYTASLIQKNLGLFNFNKETIEDILNKIPTQINLAITIRSFDILDQFRDNIVEAAKKNFEGQFEENILIILIDSHLYPTLIKKGLISSKSSTSSSSSSCFVITAAMGDRNHPSVLFLQSFRDTWLIRRSWGCWANRCYKKVGPHLAAVIRDNEYLQFLSRLFIVQPGVFIAKLILSKKG
jgi:C4-type Zn-finger protein